MPTMKKLKLDVTTQGIKGKGTHTKEQAFALITTMKNGHTQLNISVDTYSGMGNSYKENEDHAIIITFPGFQSWQGTPEELKTILKIKK